MALASAKRFVEEGAYVFIEAARLTGILQTSAKGRVMKMPRFLLSAVQIGSGSV
jgi:hypothetical protein